MKKTAIILLVVLMLLSIASCKSIKTFNNDNQGSNNFYDSRNSNVITDSEGVAGDGNVQGTSADSIQFGIVAESRNVISSRDKEKVLNKLDSELRSLFKNINSIK
jgi:hypothetical protein